MAGNESIDDLDFLIQEFQKSYETTYRQHYADPNDEKNLHFLAKQIVERITPDELVARDGQTHDFGYKLTKIFRNIQDKDDLIKIAKLYEDKGEYIFAKENYLLSSDWDNILGFVSRSIQNPKSINEGISALKQLKGDIEKIPPFLVEMAYYRAFGFRKYGLALDIAYLINDKWKEEEVLRATGLTQNQLLQ